MRTVLIPLAFSLLLTLLFYPLFKRFNKWNIGRIPSMIICMILSTAFVAGLIVFIDRQIVNSLKNLLQL